MAFRGLEMRLDAAEEQTFYAAAELSGLDHGACIFAALTGGIVLASGP
jgi:hypothetical protein